MLQRKKPWCLFCISTIFLMGHISIDHKSQGKGAFRVFFTGFHSKSQDKRTWHIPLMHYSFRNRWLYHVIITWNYIQGYTDNTLLSKILAVVSLNFLHSNLDNWGRGNLLDQSDRLFYSDYKKQFGIVEANFSLASDSLFVHVIFMNFFNNDRCPGGIYTVI